jgi:hypothetical protein
MWFYYYIIEIIGSCMICTPPISRAVTTVCFIMVNPNSGRESGFGNDLIIFVEYQRNHKLIIYAGTRKYQTTTTTSLRVVVIIINCATAGLRTLSEVHPKTTHLVKNNHFALSFSKQLIWSFGK